MEITMADLIDFVEQNHRVQRSSLAECLHDKSGAARNVRTSVTANLRFITYATKRNTLKWSPECFGNGLTE
jgi:hypothetical protein